MDLNRFQQAIEMVIDKEKIQDGIGTLGEKTVHAVLKHYLSPDITCHEIKVDTYYADILNEKGIIEIQTANFNKLRKKLEVFLESYPVTIVYPISHLKYLRWVNIETGEVSPPRKSPKKGTPYMIFPELYKIKNFLTHPNLSLHIILLDLEEYKLLDGWSKDKKKGATKSDKIPLSIYDEVFIQNVTQYQYFIPSSLPKHFTSIEYQKATGVNKRYVNIALNILNSIGVIKKVGKKGRFHLYEKP